MSLLSKKWYDKIPEDQRPVLKPAPCPLKAGNNTQFKQYGCITLRLSIQGIALRHRFWVVDTINHGLLGLDFLEKEDVDIFSGGRKLVIRGETVKIHDNQGQPIRSKVTMSETVHIPPGHEFICPGRVHNVSASSEAHVIMEPAQLAYQKTGVLVAKTLLDAQGGTVPVRLYNPSTETLIVRRNTTVGVLSGVTDIAPLSLSSQDMQSAGSAAADITINHIETMREPDPNPELRVPSHVRELYLRDREPLTPTQDLRFQNLLNVYADQFAKNSADFGVTHLIKHDIPTGSEAPVHQRVRRLPQQQVPILREQIESLHRKGIIRPSRSDWASNILLVRKKDGTWRLCIDYRELNAKTKSVDPYMLPRIDDTLDALECAKYFTTLDLIAGYHQIKLTDSAKPKTAFVTPRITPSHWEYNYMPFGVQGGPSTFQRLMDKLLHGLEYQIALAYLDDIIVYASTIDELLERCHIVFERLTRWSVLPWISVVLSPPQIGEIELF